MAYLKSVISNNNKPVNIHQVKVYEFTLFIPASREDANEEIANWKASKEGMFVTENAVVSIHDMAEYTSLVHRYAIVAEIEEKKLSEYYLKFGKI